VDAPRTIDAPRSTSIARPRLAWLRRTWPLVAALAVILALGAGLSCSTYGRPAAVSAFLLPDMMAELPLRPVTWFTDEPVVEHVSLADPDGRIVADIYRPADGERHSAIVFSMGAPPLDLDDSRLRKLAEDSARAGLVMLVPFSERLDAEMLEPAEVESLVGLFEYLQQQPYVDPERVGYMGVSVGGSLALLAAADPRIADDVDFVVSFGGYYNGVDALREIGTQRVAYDGIDEEWEPDQHTVKVMARQLIAAMDDADDRRLLTQAFVRRQPVTQADLSSMTSEGRAAYELLNKPDPGDVDALLAALPPDGLAKLEELSPSRNIDEVQAELYIIHDQSDKFVPYVESRRLRDALGSREDVHFTEVSLFEHVEPRLGRGGDVIVLDGTRLLFRLYQLLLDLG
jgi:dienelactone hydrolase